MDNRLIKLFAESEDKLLSLFVTAGYPGLDDTVPLCKLLQEHGADLLEIGIPFSDSLVDGPTIQECNSVALENGMTIERLFNDIKEVRSSVDIPLILMGCFNPILQYGVEEFCQTASERGIDGAIIPDLPLTVYVDEYREIFERYNLSNIFLVTSNTSEERIRAIDEVSSGFIYVVSFDSTTGTKLAVDQERDQYFRRLAGMNLRNPLVVGFGIQDQEGFDAAVEHLDGGIVASAFLKTLGVEGSLEDKVASFMKRMGR